MQDPTIEAVAALVARITENNKFLHDYIVEWLVDDNGSNAAIGLLARRAVMATLSNHEGKKNPAYDECCILIPSRKATEDNGKVPGDIERKVANTACADFATRR